MVMDWSPAMLLGVLLALTPGAGGAQVHFTNGFRVSELAPRSAIVWTRLSGQAAPNPVVHERRAEVFRHPIDFDEGMPIAEMDGAVSGAEGFVRVVLTGGGTERATEWSPAVADEDYTVHVSLDSLEPATAYRIELQGALVDGGPAVATAGGTFRTAPLDSVAVPVTFTASTCQYFWSYDDSVAGFRSYGSMAELGPDFFVQTGDYVYYDYYDKPGPLATTRARARHKWHAISGWPAVRELFSKTPTYFVKDDHDLLSDDAHPETADYAELSYAEGLSI